MTLRIELESLSVRSSARFQYVILPFDVRDFSICLTELGYRLHKSLSSEPSGSPPSVGLAGSGTVGILDEFLVDINTERQSFGVTGGNPASSLEKLTDIFAKMKSKGLTDIENVHFFEFQGLYRTSLEHAQQSISRCGEGSKVVEGASKVFDKKMSLFSARVVAEDSKLDSPNYMEILFQPLITRPESELTLSVVCRNPDLATFKNFVSDIEDKATDFLQYVLEE